MDFAAFVGVFDPEQGWLTDWAELADGMARPAGPCCGDLIDCVFDASFIWPSVDFAP